MRLNKAFPSTWNSVRNYKVTPCAAFRSSQCAVAPIWCTFSTSADVHSELYKYYHDLCHVHALQPSVLTNLRLCSGGFPRVEHVHSVLSRWLFCSAYQIMLHCWCSCVLLQTPCAIVLQCVGLQLHLRHLHNTVCSVFQPAVCVQVSKTLLFIVAPLWMALHSPFPWFHLGYMQSTSSLGYLFFMLTRCYLRHLAQRVSCHCCQEARKKYATELRDCPSYRVIHLKCPTPQNLTNKNS